MSDFPTLDTHCHLAPDSLPSNLWRTGFAHASTLSLEEAESVIARQEPQIAWGAGCHPRFVSIHSYRATGLVLEELRQAPISTPVLHWWTGSAGETSEAVELGCYFSIHSAVARHAKFRTRVPPERILVESDHGYADPPAGIPCRVEWVEHLLAQQLKVEVEEIRRLVWRNFTIIVQATGTMSLFPRAFVEIMRKVIEESKP